MSLFGKILGAFTSSDKRCDWYSDNCNVYLNKQSGSILIRVLGRVKSAVIIMTFSTIIFFRGKRKNL